MLPVTKRKNLHTRHVILSGAFCYSILATILHSYRNTSVFGLLEVRGRNIYLLLFGCLCKSSLNYSMFHSTTFSSLFHWLPARHQAGSVALLKHYISLKRLAYRVPSHRLKVCCCLCFMVSFTVLRSYGPTLHLCRNCESSFGQPTDFPVYATTRRRDLIHSRHTLPPMPFCWMS